MYRRKTAVHTDERVKVMNEIIAGMRVIKMYCWEKPFGQFVEKIRRSVVWFFFFKYSFCTLDRTAESTLSLMHFWPWWNDKWCPEKRQPLPSFLWWQNKSVSHWWHVQHCFWWQRKFLSTQSRMFASQVAQTLGSGSRGCGFESHSDSSLGLPPAAPPPPKPIPSA